MWVARARWAQVWMVVKLRAERTQYCIVGDCKCCIVGNWTCFSFLFQAFKLCMGVSLQSHWGHVWALGFRVVQATCRWVITNVEGHLFCSQIVVPDWNRGIFLLLIQTIYLFWLRCLHCCSQRNDFSPSDGSGQQSLDLRSCFVTPVYKSVQWNC